MRWLVMVIGCILVVWLWACGATPVEASELVQVVELRADTQTANPSAIPHPRVGFEKVAQRPSVQHPRPAERWDLSRLHQGQGRRRRRKRSRRRKRRRVKLAPRQGTRRVVLWREGRVSRRERKSTAEETVRHERELEIARTKAWVTQEMGQVTLGDARLESRLHTLVTQLAQKPTASIPQACGSWAAAKAAYRFFDNERVTHEAVLEGHRKACLERMSEEELVLVAQDTTALSYSYPETEGLGRLDRNGQGLMVHTSLVVSDGGVPLGLLDQQVWVRDPKAVGKKHSRKKRPIEEKESYKWLKGLRASLKGLPSKICVVTVADREADVYDFFLEGKTQQTQLLVRAAWDRRLSDPPGYLREIVSSTPVRDHFVVDVGRAKDRDPREAKVALRFAPVTIKPPRYRRHESGLSPLPLYAIEVCEEKAPAEQPPLHWLLLTNRPVETVEEARRCVRWYGLRWLVERYHFVLKSGCQIEKRQLGTRERLERCLSVYAIVAWRLLWLTYQARVKPRLPCSVALERHEWQALYCYVHKISVPPNEPPPLDQAVRWIAQLGGFLGRKRDGEPGVKVLWRGWQRLQDIAETWQLFHPPPDVGNA